MLVLCTFLEQSGLYLLLLFFVVFLGGLYSGLFLFCFFNSTLFCADGQCFSTFFPLHIDMVFEYPRDNWIIK